jgi:hypothetical protein
MLFKKSTFWLAVSICFLPSWTASSESGKPIVIDQVEAVTVSTVNQPDPSKPKGRTCSLKGKDAQRVLRGLGIGMPEQPGVPAAMVTAHLKIRSKHNERTFRVYNDLLLNDEQDLTVYFRLKAPITSKLCS